MVMFTKQALWSKTPNSQASMLFTNFTDKMIGDKMNKLYRKIMVIIIITSLFSISANALYFPTYFYDNRASSYTKIGDVDSDYNCLAYSLGITNDWVWPWGASNPSPYQAQNTLNLLYGLDETSVFQGEIIAYGNSNEITHFSKESGFNTCKAKWGGLELFSHNSRDPYADINTGTDKYGTYGYGNAEFGLEY